MVSSLNTAAKRIYLEAFLKQKSDNPASDFASIYQSQYGRYRLVVPSILLALVLLPLTFLVCERAVLAVAVANGWTPSLQYPKFLMVPSVAVAAIAGAYTWNVSALISGAAGHNLPPGTLLSAVLRLVVAVPMGYAIASLATESLGPFIAFSIGAFPLSTVQLILQKIGAKQLNLDAAPDAKRDQLVKLSGIDTPIADRLGEADVSTVPQLAYCDPVQISMRTNLSFQFVLDLVSQALAWIYLEDKLNDLRKLGLRGTVEVRSLLENLDSDDTEEHDAAQILFGVAAGLVGITPAEAFRGVCEEMAFDPYTDFVWEVWQEAGVVVGSMQATLDEDGSG